MTVPISKVDFDATVARLLAEKARLRLDAGEVVAPYLLFSEAARRDPRSQVYRDERDGVEPTAKLLLKTKLESKGIKKDIVAAERQAFALEASGELDPVVVPVPPAQHVDPPLTFATRPDMAQDQRTDASRSPAANAPAPQTSIPLPPPTEDAAQPHDKSKPVNLTVASQLLAYGTYDWRRTNSLFNPDNQLAQFPSQDFDGSLRTDFKLTSSIFSLSAKPRVDYALTSTGRRNDVNSYLQEWSARVQVLPSLTLSYGREVPMWGPSLSVPASNPWYRDNGRNTPLLELGARDFGRIVWQPSAKFSLSYIANTALRRGTPSFLPFRPTGAIKADYIGKSILFSGIYSNSISSPLGQRKFVGGYLQGTVGQSLRMYVEGSAQQGNPGYFPESANGTVGYSQSRTYYSLAPRTIVGGLAYTDLKAGTWTGEYIYNPFGYTDMVADSFYAIAQQLSSTYLQGGINARLAAEELSISANPGIGLLRRNYAFGQYQRNGFFRNFDIVVRYTLNLEDHGGEGVGFLTWNTNDHLQIFAVIAALNGSAETEFARYLHFQTQIGFRLFIH